MNVLIVSAVFPPEPVVSSILSSDIAVDLVENGNNVTVICPRQTRPSGYKISNEDHSNYKFEKVILNSHTSPESKIIGRFRESFSFGQHCYRFIKKNYKNIDIIYANTWPLFAQYFLVKSAGKYNIPVILHIQDIYPESIAEKQSGIFRWILLFLFIPIDKLILRKCSKIVTISSHMKEYLVRTRQIDTTKVFVVRNWQNDDKFLNVHHSDRTENSEFIFMYLGSINPSANVITLINAFVKARLKNCKLIIAGEGSNKPECLKVAQQYPDENIEFITAPVDEVHKIQQQADVLLLPLKKGIAKTATPSKLTAYMFSGKPIIACVDEVSDTANCILEAKCGLVIEPENQERLAISMQNIIKSDKILLEEFGKNSINYAIANFSKKVNLGKMISIITGEINDQEKINRI